jgi:hypothetical protein
MSFLTATNVECIAACATAGASLSDSATATVLNVADGAAYLPVNFFKGNLYRTVLVTATGIYSSPSSGAATMQIGVTLDAAQGTTGSLTFLPGAITPVASASSWPWELFVTLTVQSLTETTGSGTANIVGMGHLNLHGAAFAGAQSLSTSASQSWQVPVGSTSTVDQSTVAGVFCEIYGKFATAVSGSTMQLEMSAIYGCN